MMHPSVQILRSIGKAYKAIGASYRDFLSASLWWPPYSC